MICFQYESTFNFFTAGTMASKSSISVIKKKARIRKGQLYLVIGSDEARISMQRQTLNQRHTGAFKHTRLFSNSVIGVSLIHRASCL